MKSIKFTNDILISQEALGKVLWEGNFRIGETKNIPNLSKYKYLEFLYTRGNDYGAIIVKTPYSNKHVSATIVYVGGFSGSFWRKRTANIYWSDDNVEFRNVLEENESGSSVSTATNTNDNLYRIIGYN